MIVASINKIGPKVYGRGSLLIKMASFPVIQMIKNYPIDKSVVLLSFEILKKGGLSNKYKISRSNITG